MKFIKAVFCATFIIAIATTAFSMKPSFSDSIFDYAVTNESESAVCNFSVAAVQILSILTSSLTALPGV